MERQSPLFAKIMNIVYAILTIYLRGGRFFRAKEGQTAIFTQKRLEKSGLFRVKVITIRLKSITIPGKGKNQENN